MVILTLLRVPEHFHISPGAHTPPDPALLLHTDHSILFPLAGEVIKNTRERFPYLQDLQYLTPVKTPTNGCKHVRKVQKSHHYTQNLTPFFYAPDPALQSTYGRGFREHRENAPVYPICTPLNHTRERCYSTKILLTLLYTPVNTPQEYQRVVPLRSPVFESSLYLI